MKTKSLILLFLVIAVVFAVAYVCVYLFTDIRLPSFLLESVLLSLLLAYFLIKNNKA